MIRNVVLGLCLFFLSFGLAQAGETVPIPPKRPAIMHVSPSFLAQLQSRATKNESQPIEVAKPAPPAPPPVQKVAAPEKPKVVQSMTVIDSRPIDNHSESSKGAENLEDRLIHPTVEEVLQQIEKTGKF